jgi:hypothetical protein
MLIWCIAQFMGITLLWYFTFFMWAPRWTARTHKEVVVNYGAQDVPDCDAIHVNHGVFTCLPWGAPFSDPSGFAALTVVLISGFGLVVISRIANKGFFAAECSEAVHSRINAVRLRFGLKDVPLRRARSAIFGMLMFFGVLANFLGSIVLAYVRG